MAATPSPAPSAPGGPAGPPPDEPQGTGGGGSNLPGILVGVVLLLLIAGALVWFLVLADDEDDEDLRSEVIASLRAEEGLSAADADCVADELDDAGQLDGIGRAIRDGDAPTSAQSVAVLDAYEACGIVDDDDDLDETTTTTEDDENGADGPGIAFPPAMIRMAAEEMAAEMGITTDQAECFLNGMFEALSDEQFEAMLTDPDSLDPSDIFGDAESFMMLFELMEECGIDPFQLDGGFDDFDNGFGPGSGVDTYGDDPALDALWDACEAGDDEACDDLYMRSPFGSEYEEFGDTCAGRGRDGLWCSD